MADERYRHMWWTQYCRIMQSTPLPAPPADCERMRDGTGNMMIRLQRADESNDQYGQFRRQLVRSWQAALIATRRSFIERGEVVPPGEWMRQRRATTRAYRNEQFKVRRTRAAILHQQRENRDVIFQRSFHSDHRQQLRQQRTDHACGLNIPEPANSAVNIPAAGSSRGAAMSGVPWRDSRRRSK